MSLQEVRVPDLGDFKDIPVIDVLVKPGDAVEKDAPLVTLESDKATMDVPSPLAGVVREVKVKPGDKLSMGSLVLVLEVAQGGAVAAPAAPAVKPAAVATSAAPAAAPRSAPPPAAPPPPPAAPAAPLAPALSAPPPIGLEPPPPVDEAAFRSAHAGPGARRFARELGVDLAQIAGSGPKGRILRDDVEAWVKARLAAPPSLPPPAPSGGGLELLPWPKVDYAKYGPIERKPLSKIRRIGGANLHRNWVQIPHVTSCEDADVTDVEAFRQKINHENDKASPKVTLLAFLIKAVVAALQKFPEFNGSLDGDQIVLKHYWNIGFAADTPNGLLVPVIKDADRKGILAIAKETAELAGKAREGKLLPAEMQGATFSLSSLGGIGGTYFTPIINAPEVAILGVCRTAMKPVWDGEKFAPRLILPLSLSWDHRVVDGAGAARFNAFVAGLLGDARRLVL